MATRKCTCTATPKRSGGISVKARCPPRAMHKGKRGRGRIPRECSGLSGRSLTQCKKIMRKKYTL